MAWSFLDSENTHTHAHCKFFKDYYDCCIEVTSDYKTIMTRKKRCCVQQLKTTHLCRDRADNVLSGNQNPNKLTILPTSVGITPVKRSCLHTLSKRLLVSTSSLVNAVRLPNSDGIALVLRFRTPLELPIIPQYRC